MNDKSIGRGEVVLFIPNQDAAVAVQEEVIIGKLAYYHEGGSDKHLRENTGILEFSGDFANRDYIATARQNSAFPTFDRQF